MQTTGGGTNGVQTRLAGMMFLQYFGLGAWIVPVTRFLPGSPAHGGMGLSPGEFALIFMTLPIGAIITPFVVGLLADRYFAAEKLLVVLHLGMAGFIAAAGWWCSLHAGPMADPAVAVAPLFWLMLGYSVCCQISMTLTNVISFRNLSSRGKFGYVRLVGTLGWVVAGVIVGWALDPLSADPFWLAATGSVALAGYAYVLPHTPPQGHGRPVREVLGLPAFTLFRDRSFVVFALALTAGNALNQFYVMFISPYLADLGVRAPEGVLTIAQVVEIACMAAVPRLVPRLGVKGVMLLGLCGWVVRGGLLYLANVPLVLALAVPMHGWSYAFFGMLGSLFVDREAPPHLRGGGHALLTFLGSGPAVIVGNLLATQVVASHRVENLTSWPAVWLIPFVGYALIAVGFAVWFREPPGDTMASDAKAHGP